jgi:PAS domain S-box-containing protein
MDTQTLIIAALTVSLAINLSMAIVFWTRRSYPGFGYWLAGTLCRTLAGLLLLLPRDQYPPWLTLILANYLLLVELLLYIRGTRLFRGLPVGFGGEIIVSVLFLGFFAYFTYVSPNLNTRILVFAISAGVLELEMIRVLLTRRPAYFGSSDRWQAGIWGALVVTNLARAGYSWAFASPVTDLMAMPLNPDFWILVQFLVLAALLIALSQIIMNAQRLEYDLRLAREGLEQDIRRRQETEEKLRLSEERHRLLADNANDVIWTMGLDGSITYVSPAVERVRGITPEEAMRQGIEEIHPPDSQAISLGYFQKLYAQIQAGQPPENFRGELEYYCKDGSTFWTEVMAYPMRDADGTIREILGVTRDIAAHKAAEAQLKASESRMRKMLDQVPTAISVASLTDEPRLLFLNEQFVRTFGYTLEDVPTQRDWVERAFRDAGNQGELMTGWNLAEARLGQGKVESREFKVSCKDGQRRDVIISATVMDDILLTSFVDITERKQMEEARRESEERFRLLANNAVDNIWTLGLDRVFTYTSPSVESLLGYTPEEFLRLALEDILTPPSLSMALEYLTHLGTCIQTGLPLKQFRGELEVRRKDGARVWTEVIASPQLDAEGRMMALVGVTRDISERKRFETELLQARDATETANRALRDANEQLKRLAATDTSHRGVESPAL